MPRDHRDHKERLKEKVIMLIDDSTNNWAKMAFYSDSNVARILDDVYKRWESNGRKGLPIDYASYEELQILAFAAEKYKNTGPEVLSQIMFSDRDTHSKKRKKESLLRKLLGL